MGYMQKFVVSIITEGRTVKEFNCHSSHHSLDSMLHHQLDCKAGLLKEFKKEFKSVILRVESAGEQAEHELCTVLSPRKSDCRWVDVDTDLNSEDD